jgi:hypothetical protein
MIVDTAGLFPESKGLIMECSGIPAERLTRGTVFWDFDFTTQIEGDSVPYRESVPIWLAGPVFKALGFKEVTPGRYDVEPTMAIGRKFKCDIVHETIKDKPYARMKNMVPIQGGLKPEDINEQGIPF